MALMTDSEVLVMIEDVLKNYKGDLGYLNEAVGLIVLGRLMGWEHQRLVVDRRVWSFALKYFGDLKRPELMPKRGVYAYKSMALKIADRVGGFLLIVKSVVSVPIKERRVME